MCCLQTPSAPLLPFGKILALNLQAFFGKCHQLLSQSPASLQPAQHFVRGIRLCRAGVPTGISLLMLGLNLLPEKGELFGASTHARGMPEAGAGREVFCQLVPVGQANTFVLQHPGARAAAGISSQGISILPATVIHRAQ